MTFFYRTHPILLISQSHILQIVNYADYNVGLKIKQTVLLTSRNA